MIGIKENLFWVAIFGFMMFLFMPAIHEGVEVLIRKNLDNEEARSCFWFDCKLCYPDGLCFAFILSGVLSDYIFKPFMRGNT